MRIDLPGIEAFLAIANWGSFKRASGHLNLSQAALSHRIRKLEDSLGVALLARTTRRVTLTSAGLELLPVAQRLVDDVSSTLHGLRERSGQQPERLAIGCLPTIAMLHLPAVLTEFGRLRPEVRVQVYDNSASEIAERVRSAEIEFGVTIVSAESWNLEITPVVKDPYVLVCALSHPLASRPCVQWRDLEEEPLIRISAGAWNRQLIDEALGSRREIMRWRHEVQHIATAISMVRGGLGLTVIPRSGLLAQPCDSLIAVPLRNPAAARTLGMIARRDVPLPPNAALLMRLIAKRLKATAQPVEVESAMERTTTKRSGSSHA